MQAGGTDNVRAMSGELEEKTVWYSHLGGKTEWQFSHDIVSQCQDGGSFIQMRADDASFVSVVVEHMGIERPGTYLTLEHTEGLKKLKELHDVAQADLLRPKATSFSGKTEEDAPMSAKKRRRSCDVDCRAAIALTVPEAFGMGEWEFVRLAPLTPREALAVELTFETLRRVIEYVGQHITDPSIMCATRPYTARSAQEVAELRNGGYRRRRMKRSSSRMSITNEPHGPPIGGGVAGWD